MTNRLTITGIVKFFNEQGNYGYLLPTSLHAKDVRFKGELVKNGLVTAGDTVEIEVDPADSNVLLGITKKGSKKSRHRAAAKPQETVGEIFGPVFGKVKFYDRKVRHFGFINVDGLDADIYVHIAVLTAAKLLWLTTGDHVFFSYQRTDRGYAVTQIALCESSPPALDEQPAELKQAA